MIRMIGLIRMIRMIRRRGLIVNEEQEIGYREGEEIINQVIITTIKLLLIIIIIHKNLCKCVIGI